MATSSERIRKVLAQIKTEPYYSVRIAPTHTMDSLSIPTCKSIVSEIAVRLRGWDFPHFDPNDVAVADSYIFSSVDWQQHVEMWRMYQSRQFVYLGASWDTAMDFQKRLRTSLPRMVVQHESVRDSVRGVMSFIGIIYTVTEFYLFASRLADKCGYRDNVRLEIALHNIEDWVLAPGDPSVPWHGFYQARINEIRIPSPKAAELLNKEDAAASARRGLALLFERFNWENSQGAIDQWQKQLIEGRFAY